MSKVLKVKKFSNLLQDYQYKIEINYLKIRIFT